MKINCTTFYFGNFFGLKYPISKTEFSNWKFPTLHHHNSLFVYCNITALHMMFVHVGQRKTDHVGRSVALGGRSESGNPGQPLLVEPLELTVALQLVVGQTDVAQPVEIGKQSRRQRGQVVVVQRSENNLHYWRCVSSHFRIKIDECFV